MMNKCRALLFLAVAVLLLASGCSRPETTEQFIKEGEADGGVYSFELALEDSVGTYDFSFFTRIDSPLNKPQTSSLRLNVVWRSPSGESAGETVYMDGSKMCEKYRSGVSPKECGKWTMEVRIPDKPKGFRGLGIICTHNGTR